MASRKEIIASLKRHNGKLCLNASEEMRTCDGNIFDYVAMFDSIADYDNWSEEEEQGGPSDFINGIFHVWFNGEE